MTKNAAAKSWSLPVQIDGRRYVEEIHTDHLGVAHRVEYLAAVGADTDAIAAARAIQIAAQLADEEATAIMGQD